MADHAQAMEQMLREVLARHQEWKHLDGVVDVPTERGERHQRVHIELVGHSWEFRSVVLGSEAVTRSVRVWRELAVRAWSRNGATNVVTFSFDEEDQLIGLVRHMAAHLDADELDLYLSVLAAECDRFEYLLGGVDVS